jgi:hypothetical protein
VIAAIQLRRAADEDEQDFQQRAYAALRVLAGCTGYLAGSVGRATDDAAAWLLLTQWQTVGSYRRALGSYQVKLVATPLMAQALDLPSAFEELLVIDQAGAETESGSDRAGDADWVGRRPDR